jgi:hypothetical protein
MKNIPASEIDKFKNIYFRDFFSYLTAFNLQIYFQPFWKEDYCLKSKSDIGYWLWDQYKAIFYKLDTDVTMGYLNLLFERYCDDEDFIRFLFDYKKYYEKLQKTKWENLTDNYEGFHYRGLAVYYSSSFRLNEEETLKHFCFWLKKNGIYSQIEICGNTNWQKKICKQYLDAYFNRTPIVQKKSFISDLTSIVRNFFSK